MYALSISVRDEELQRALLDEAFGAKVHVDRGTQVELAFLERFDDASTDDAEVSEATGILRPGSAAGIGGARLSGGASPFWPVDEDDREAMWGEDDEGEEEEEGDSDEQGLGDEEDECQPCAPRPQVGIWYHTSRGFGHDTISQLPTVSHSCYTCCRY